MKTRLKYVPLAIASSIVSIIALIGTYIVYSSLNQLMNGEGDYFSTLSSFSMSSLSNGAKLFGFGCLAVAVVSIILIVYYIYEERKLSIIITAVIGIIEFILFVHFFDTIGSALSNIGSYLFGSDFSYNDILGSMHGSLLLVLLVSLIGAIINIVILLQMYHVIHISFLQPYMPSLQMQTQTVVEPETKQDEGGESQ